MKPYWTRTSTFHVQGSLFAVLVLLLLFLTSAAGDFRLRPDSPCIDGSTNVTALSPTDLLGLSRALDGNGDGHRPRRHGRLRVQSISV